MEPLPQPATKYCALYEKFTLYIPITSPKSTVTVGGLDEPFIEALKLKRLNHQLSQIFLTEPHHYKNLSFSVMYMTLLSFIIGHSFKLMSCVIVSLCRTTILNKRTWTFHLIFYKCYGDTKLIIET